MVGPDGTIYLSRQINASTDFFYAFHDTGAALVEKWHVASASAPFSEFAVGTDGSVYMIASSNEIHRLDPETGATLNSSEPLPSGGFFIARMAIDALGRLFFSEGVVFDSRLRAFEADLTPLWDVPVDRINIGGPSLGDGGTLITCGANDIRAYRDQNARPSLK
jgi:streptogramin lyase